MPKTPSLRRIVTVTALFTGLLLGRFLRAEEATVASEQRLLDSVKYLASDELEGRGPGTKGIDLAADFIAAEFTKAGLKTDLFEGSQFQNFSFTIATEMGPVEQNKLSFVGPLKDDKPQVEALKLEADFMPLALGGSTKVDLPLAFVGYGITAKGDNWSYDDYDGLDVKGKIVIVIRKEPQQRDEKSVFDGLRPSRHAQFMTKAANASEHGAAGIIFVNDGLELTSSREQSEKQWNDSIAELIKIRAAFAEKKEPTPEEIEKHQKQVTDLAARVVELGKELQGNFDTLLPFNGAGGDDGKGRKMPVYFCSRAAINKLLAAAGKESLEQIETSIDKEVKPRSFELSGWKAEGETNLLVKKADTKNVIGVLEGEGPLADETIVIGAHYDHLGFGGAGSLAPWTKEIHNGADDNASGTSTLLELAYRLGTSGQKPARRIVFMAFSGEERGLLGSAYYTKNPRFSLEKTVAMFNLDMVGRLKDNKLIVYGTGTAKEFDPLVSELGKQMQFAITKHPEGFGPSDHSSFYAKKIPVLHFFTGTHSEYHRPSDDVELVNVEGMRRVADMVEAIVLKTDKAAARPQYVENKRHADITASDNSGQDPVAGDRPYFGSIPDYASEEEGVLLSGVQPDSPADKAGLKAGDLIIKFGESRVTNIEDYMGAMMKFKPGDKVKIGVQRGKEKAAVELEATLTKRPSKPMP